MKTNINNVMDLLVLLVMEGGETYQLKVGMSDPETFFAKIATENDHTPLFDFQGDKVLYCESVDSLEDALYLLNQRCAQ